MESLWIKVEELDRWRNMEKNISSGLPGIKAYDIRLHTLATNECQELASMFEQKVKKSLVGMMNMINQLKIFKSISNFLRSISKINTQLPLLSFRSLKMHMNLSRERFNRKHSFQRKTFNSFL